VLTTGEKRSAGTDIQNRAEIQKLASPGIRAAYEYRNGDRKPRPLPALFSRVLHFFIPRRTPVKLRCLLFLTFASAGEIVRKANGR
jgi:hypothetical protein